MIKHIVMWSLKDEYNGRSKAMLAQDLEKVLLDLKNKIPQLKKIEVGHNEINFDRNNDLAIVTEFESFEDLAIYANHPDHLKVVAFVREISTARAAIDFTIK